MKQFATNVTACSVMKPAVYSLPCECFPSVEWRGEVGVDVVGGTNTRSFRPNRKRCTHACQHLLFLLVSWTHSLVLSRSSYDLFRLWTPTALTAANQNKRSTKIAATAGSHNRATLLRTPCWNDSCDLRWSGKLVYIGFERTSNCCAACLIFSQTFPERIPLICAFQSTSDRKKCLDCTCQLFAENCGRLKKVRENKHTSIWYSWRDEPS